MNGETGMQPDPLAVLPEQPRGHRVEGAAPHPRGGRAVRGGAPEQPIHAPQELGRGATGEGEEEDPLRRDTSRDELRHPVGEGGGLPRPRTGNHQQRGVAMEHCLALRLVEPIEHSVEGG